MYDAHYMEHSNQSYFMSSTMCDTPIPGVPLTTRQPAETCGYRVSRYHTHLSHILRLIPAYLIHKYTKYMIDYLINNPFIQQKCIHVLLEYNTRQKQNKTKPHPALIPHAVPYAGQMPAPDLYLKRGPMTG